jgi:hypothetical protein
MKYAWNDVLNQPGQAFFMIAVIGVSIVMMIFHIVIWPYYIKNYPENKIAAIIAMIFGIVSCLIFIGVGAFPKGHNDPIVNPHSLFANLYGFINFGLLIPWYIIIANEDKTNKQLMVGLIPGIFYVFSIFMYLVVPWFVDTFADDSHWWQPTWQKFIIFGFIYWYMTFSYWMYQKGFKIRLPPVGPGLHDYQVYTSHNTYQVPKSMKGLTPDQVIERYMKTYNPHGFEFDIFEEKGNYIVKHFIIDSDCYDLKTWLQAVRNNLDRSSDPGPYHVYIEMKAIKDTRKFPEKFDQIIQSAFQGSKIHVFSQKDYKNNGNKFPEPSGMQNMIMFQISGSAGETSLFKPICDILYHICQGFCTLFAAKKNYDKWDNENKLAFPDITGFNFRTYRHRAFINFPTFMLIDLNHQEILDQQKQGKVIRAFLVDEKFMHSSDARIPNILATEIDPTKIPQHPLPSWWKK